MDQKTGELTINYDIFFIVFFYDQFSDIQSLLGFAPIYSRYGSTNIVTYASVLPLYTYSSIVTLLHV